MQVKKPKIINEIAVSCKKIIKKYRKAPRIKKGCNQGHH